MLCGPSSVNVGLGVARLAVILFAYTSTLTSCVCIHKPGKCGNAVYEDKAELLASKFQATAFSSKGKQRTVFIPITLRRKGNAAAILLLHELPALSAECLLLADRLADEGYDVYVPMLFGRSDDRDREDPTATFVKNAIEMQLSGDWHPLFAEHKSSGITNWLRGFCREKIIQQDRHKCIAVIGMCATGAIPLALLDVREVKAVVLSQPALPLFKCTAEGRRALGISREELRLATERSFKENLPILGFRFEKDPICPPTRFCELRVQFGPRFLDRTISASDCEASHIPVNAHSVLTGCYVESTRDTVKSPTQKAYLQMLTYLAKRLRHETDG